MRGSRLLKRDCEKKCEKIVTPPFHFDHLLTQVPKSPYFIHRSEYAIIFIHFFGLCLQWSGLSQKCPKKYMFLFRNVIWQHGSFPSLKNQIIACLRTKFHPIFGVFLERDMTRCVHPFIKKPNHSLFEDNILSYIEVNKSKNKCVFYSVHFSNDFKINV